MSDNKVLHAKHSMGSLALLGSPLPMSPLSSLVVTKALQAHQAGADWAGVSRDGLALVAKVQRYSKPKDLIPHLLSDAARRLGVPEAVRQSVLDGQLLFSARGVRELGLSQLEGSLAIQATRAAQRLSATGSDAAQKTFAFLMEATMGKHMMEQGSMASLFDQEDSLREALWQTYSPTLDESAKRLLDGMWDGQAFDPATVRTFAEQTNSDMRSMLTQEFEFSKFGLGGLKNGLNTGTEPTPGPAEMMAQFRVGAQVLTTVLTFVNADPKLINFIQRSVTYMQAGVQIGQCLAVLAAGGSGWGAAMAVSGLAGGMGGLGAFGGPGGDEGQANAQQTMLLALQGMLEEMRAQFKVVNSRLDQVTQLLGEVLMQLGDIRADQQQLLNKVAVVDESVRALSLTTTRSLSSLAKLVLADKHTDCMAYRDVAQAPTELQLAGCMRHYAETVALSATASPIQQDSASLGQAFDLVASGFSPAADPEEAWSCQMALSRVLREHFRLVSVPEKVLHRPVFAFAVDNFSEMVALAPDSLHKVNQANPAVYPAHVQRLKDVLAFHDAFVASLRRAANPVSTAKGALDALLEVALAQVQTFRTAYEGLEQAIASRMLAELELDGRWARPNPEGGLLIGSTGVAWKMFFEEDTTGVTPRVSRVYTALIDLEFGELPPNQMPLLGWFEGRELLGREVAHTHMSQFQLFVEHVKLTTRFMLYGQNLPRENNAAVFEATLGFTDEAEYLRVRDSADLAEYVTSVPSHVTPGLAPLRDLVVKYLASEPVLTAARKAAMEQLMMKRKAITRQIAQACHASLESALISPMVACLRELTKTMMTLRAVAQVAHEEAYAAHDALQQFFAGGLHERMLDEKGLVAWARGVVQVFSGRAVDLTDEAHALAFPGGKAEDYATPSSLAYDRVLRLEKLLKSLQSSGESQGSSFLLEYTRAQIASLPAVDV